jgi:hypothetical protein
MQVKAQELNDFHLSIIEVTSQKHSLKNRKLQLLIAQVQNKTYSMYATYDVKSKG